MKKSIGSILGGLAIAFVASGVASADTLTGPCSTVTSTSISAAMTCSQFNLDLGTNQLQSISLTINGKMVGTITVNNLNDTDEPVTASESSTWNLSPALSGFAFTNPLFTLSFSTGLVTIPANTEVTFPSTGTFSSTSGTGGVVNSDSSTFAPYEGNGTFAIPVTSTAHGNLDNSCSNCAFASSADVTLTETGSIVYTYAPISAEIPEPGTIALFSIGSGLFLFGFRRRVKA